MNLTTTVSDLVVFFPHSIDILDRHNLDYYCNGSKSFIKACEEKNIDPARVWQEIQSTGQTSNNIQRSTQEWSAEFLMDVILRHYSDFKSSLTSIRELLDATMDKATQDERQRILRIHTCFNDLAEAVTEHSVSEEQTLHYVLEMLTKNKRPTMHLSNMEREHMEIGSLINNLRHLTKNYDGSDLSFPSADLTFIILRQFDRELTQRLHLENNLLFPKLKSASS